MTGQELLGNCLDRTVYLTTWSRLPAAVAGGVVGLSTIFIWLPTQLDGAAFREHMGELIEGAPLLLFLAGPHATSSFDATLHYLAERAPAMQIMTRSSTESLDSCLEEFLQAAWPSMERFETWSSYLLLGRASAVAQAKQASYHLLDKSGGADA